MCVCVYRCIRPRCQKPRPGDVTHNFLSQTVSGLQCVLCSSSRRDAWHGFSHGATWFIASTIDWFCGASFPETFRRKKCSKFLATKPQLENWCLETAGVNRFLMGCGIWSLENGWWQCSKVITFNHCICWAAKVIDDVYLITAKFSPYCRAVEMFVSQSRFAQVMWNLNCCNSLSRLNRSYSFVPSTAKRPKRPKPPVPWCLRAGLKVCWRSSQV